MRSILRFGASLALAAAWSVSVWAGPTATYQAVGILGELGPPPYGLRLDGFYDGLEESENTYSFDEVVFEEYADGTARLHGQVELNTLGTAQCCNYWLDVRFVRITDECDLAKIHHYRSDWRYYKIASYGPELTSQDDPTDAAEFWTYPEDGSMPFQVGYGANEKNQNFGAAGWLSFEHCYQGERLGRRGQYLPASDFLMDLNLPTDVAGASGPRPTAFSVRGNFPNPFNPSTTLEYSLESPSQVRIEIFNVYGAKVRDLLDVHQESGHHLLTWDGRDDAGKPVPSGTYLYRVATGTATETRKMILLK